jgi:cation:H+ antiporter
LLDLINITAGLAFLYYGGNFLVTGSVYLARTLKVSTFIVGSIIIAFGTSAPEFAVSMHAALDGTPELAIANVIGSNIANIGLVLGLTSLICVISIAPNRIKRESPPLLFASFLILLIAWDLEINHYEGSFMVCFLGLYIWRSFRYEENLLDEPEEETNVFLDKSLVFQVAIIILGFILLVGGAKLLVDGGIGTARKLGISEWFIGITIVSIGTSLPEIISSLIAAKRGHSEMAIGNIFGSNIFNILMVLGFTGIVHPLYIQEPIQIDLIIATSITVLLVTMIVYGNHSLGRRKGIILLLIYFAYIGLKGIGSI